MASPQAKFEITADDKTAAAFRSALSEGQKFSKQMSTILKAGIAGVAAAEITANLKQAFALGDSYGNLAAATGLAASTASELSRVFKQLGLDESLLTSSLRKMQVELSNGNTEFGKLGLSAESLKAKGADRALEDIAEAISQIPNPADRAAAAARIFGEDAGPRLLKLLNQGKEGIQEIRKELGGFAEKDIAQMEQANEAFRKLDLFSDKVWGGLAVQVTKAMTALNLIDRDAAGELGDDLRKAEAALADLMEGPGRFDKTAIAEARSEIALLKTEIERARIGAGTGTRGGGPFKPTGSGIIVDHETPKALKATSDGLQEVAVSAAQYVTEYERILAMNEIDLQQESQLYIERNKSLEAMAAALDHRLAGYDAMEAEIMAHHKIFVDTRSEYELEAARNTQDIIANTLRNGFDDGLAGIAKSFGNMILDLQAQAMAADIADYLFGGKQSDGSATSGLLSGAMSWLFSGGAGSAASTSASAASGGINATADSLLAGLPKFAKGGRPPLDMPSWVGERGPELFWPDSSGTIIPNHALGGGGSMSVTIDARTIVQGSVDKALLPMLAANQEQSINRAVAKMQQMRNEGRF